MNRVRIGRIVFGFLMLALASLAVAQAKKQVDINSATEEELVATGIEKATVKKIIEARPYRSKSELVSRQLLTRAQYDKLKDLLVAKQPLSDAKPKGMRK
jgi:DNA uptake protein ComE-like DNA-binding protein